jgi:hypothetical protein
MSASCTCCCRGRWAGCANAAPLAAPTAAAAALTAAASGAVRMQGRNIGNAKVRTETLKSTQNSDVMTNPSDDMRNTACWPLCMHYNSGSQRVGAVPPGSLAGTLADRGPTVDARNECGHDARPGRTLGWVCHWAFSAPRRANSEQGARHLSGWLQPLAGGSPAGQHTAGLLGSGNWGRITGPERMTGRAVATTTPADALPVDPLPADALPADETELPAPAVAPNETRHTTRPKTRQKTLLGR